MASRYSDSLVRTVDRSCVRERFCFSTPSAPNERRHFFSVSMSIFRSRSRVSQYRGAVSAADPAWITKRSNDLELEGLAQR